MLVATRGQPFTVDALVYSGRGLWFGYSVKNAHATAVRSVDFYDGVAATGVLIGSVSVPALTSVCVMPGAAAVRTESGLFMDLSGDSTTVVPYYMTQTRVVAGVTLLDDEDRNTDGFGLLRLIDLLDRNGLALDTGVAGE
jgi:hypothetical protein